MRQLCLVGGAVAGIYYLLGVFVLALSSKPDAGRLPKKFPAWRHNHEK
jgi:hypothetical protein